MVTRICDDMLDKLPQDYIDYEVKQRLQKMGPLQPMNIFLRQEIDRMQRVIAAVRNTLHDLKLAIDGTIIMSENLRDALDSMYDARIPKVWGKVSKNILTFVHITLYIFILVFIKKCSLNKIYVLNSVLFCLQLVFIRQNKEEKSTCLNLLLNILLSRDILKVF